MFLFFSGEIIIDILDILLPGLISQSLIIPLAISKSSLPEKKTAISILLFNIFYSLSLRRWLGQYLAITPERLSAD
jgi:hypothetical protein